MTESEQTISVDEGPRLCDYILLVVALIGLCCLGSIVFLLFIGVYCYLEEDTVNMKECYSHVNYWLFGVFSPIVGLAIYILYLCVQDICGKKINLIRKCEVSTIQNDSP